MSDIVGEILLRIFLVLIGSLIYIKELSTCAAPMHIWVIGEWVGLILAITVGASEKVRLFIGEKLAIFVFFVFCMWTVSGAFMLVYVLIKSPSCIPSSMIENMVIFTLVTLILFAVGVFALCKSGLGVFNQFFHSETQAKDVAEEIISGKIDAEEYIRSNPEIDDYVLFKKELDLFVTHCNFNVVPDPSAPADEQPECCICMDQFETDRSALRFPCCGHLYHTGCLTKWLEKKTTCPLCRQGVRSALYRQLSKKDYRGSITNEDEHKVNLNE